MYVSEDSYMQIVFTIWQNTKLASPKSVVCISYLHIYGDSLLNCQI